MHKSIHFILNKFHRLQYTNKTQILFKITNENTTKKIVTTRPRVSAISKLYNVSEKRIINFLDSLGFENICPNSLLTKEMLICTKAEFASDKNLKELIIF